jgi:hypothetical protein
MKQTEFKTYNDVKKFVMSLSVDFKKPVTFNFGDFEIFADGEEATIKKLSHKRVRYTKNLRTEEKERKEKRGIVFSFTGRRIRTVGTYNPFLKKYVCFDRYKEPDNLDSPLIVTCYCGKEFETNDTRKIWCSRKCKDLHQNESTRKSISRRLCPFCGEWYKPKQIRSQTCGKAKCRTRLSRKNERKEKY